MDHLISCGGGVQSTVLYRMACLGLIKPKPIAAIFADTGWERHATYDMIEELTEFGKEYGIPLYTVSNGNIRTDTINPTKRQPSLPFFVDTKRIITVKEQRDKLEEKLYYEHQNEESLDLTAIEEIETILKDFDRQVKEGTIKEYETESKVAMLRRQCTNEYKIRPITKLIKELTGCTFKNPCTQWIGISMDERQRQKEPRVKYLKFRYPLIEMEMTRQDCLDWLTDNGFSIPTRSSCIGCPFHSNDEWASLTPEEFEDACEFDEKKRASGMTHPSRKKAFASNRTYLHRKLVPLRERPWETTKDPAYDTHDEACDSGHCFL